MPNLETTIVNIYYENYILLLSSSNYASSDYCTRVMASILAPLIPFSLAITFVTLVAALWSHKINAIVLEPYLVSLFPKLRIILMQAG